MTVRELLDQLNILGPEALDSPVFISSPVGSTNSSPTSVVIPDTETKTIIKSVTIT